MRTDILLMILCTFFLTAAQYFEKIAGNNLELTILGILFNWTLWIGILCAGIGAILMTLALKHGELSILFPFVSLSFIWTIIIAWLAFGETLGAGSLLGIAIIIIGVITLGKTEAVV